MQKIYVSNSQCLPIKGQEKIPDFNLWELPGGDKIRLLTLDELMALKVKQPQTVLTCIDGTKEIAATCDNDIRYGFVAYGLPV